jgi:AcrR family transcriptional regulator
MSLRAVARQAGVTAPAPYLHFADHRELIWAVLVRQFEELASFTEAQAVRGGAAASRSRTCCMRFGV